MRVLARWLLVALATCVSTGCAWHHGGVLDAAGPIAEIQRRAMLETAGLVLLVIVPLFIGLPLVIWRYRLRRPRGEYRPDWTFSWFYEGLIWGLPVLLVAGLAVLTWNATARTDPFAPLPGSAGNGDAQTDTLHIQVIALDWKWLFIDRAHGIATVNTLAVPAGANVVFDLTSDATMQSLMIPRLGGQIYAMAGMVTQLRLRADRPGTYRGRNTQYNGRGFDKQSFDLHALDPAAYARWVEAVRTGPVLSSNAYAALARPGTIQRARAYRTAGSDMFAAVLQRHGMKTMPQDAMPAATGGAR